VSVALRGAAVKHRVILEYARNRHGRACPGHLDAEGTAFQQNTLGVVRALLIEITGTSPVMTSVGASISSEHAPADDAGKVTNTGGHGPGLAAIAT
jgi:hypothetical protein